MMEPTPIFDQLAAERLSTVGLPDAPDPPTQVLPRLYPRTTWRGDLIEPTTREMPPVSTQPEHVQTTDQYRKLGRLPEKVDRPRLQLGIFLRSDFKGSVPNVVDYSADIHWPMYGNDRLGDCTAADAGHAVQLWTKWGQGEATTVTDDDVIAFYSGSTGYVPGRPETDQGGYMQEVNEYFRATGLAGHKIEAFFRVNTSDLEEVRAALYLFGSVSIGMKFPRSAMDQFNRGQAWDVVKRDGGIDGGHDVLVVGMTKGGNLKVVTWGRLQEMTPAFWRKYVDEAWARVEQDWASKTNVAPANALTIDDLNAAFHDLTGAPGPFVATTTPDPEPDPTGNGPELLRLAAALESTAAQLRDLAAKS